MDHERDDEYLLPNEAAEELGGVSPKTIGRWAKQGRLPYLQTLGGHRRYPAGAIRDLAATLSHQPGGSQPAADDAVDDPDVPADSAQTGGLLPDADDADDAPLFPPGP